MPSWGCAARYSFQPREQVGLISMKTPCRILYTLRITPWDRERVPIQLARVAEKRGSRHPGRALDLGCGSGIQGVYLASRGWEVTGIDFVPQVLETARQGARNAGVEVQWIAGDVGDVGGLGLTPGYDLVYDIGCFHGLTDSARAACAHGVTELSDDHAELLLMGFRPGRRWPAPRGIDEKEVIDRFGARGLVEVEADEGSLPPLVRNAQPTWYRTLKRERLTVST
jgi:SAM-dependent methyltransferase